MVKTLVILFNIMFAIMLNVIFGEGVKVTQNSPSRVEPGSEFTVELVINKTDVSGFAKIQQELPIGFTAEPIETQGASFTFNEQKLKLIWMALPESEDFTIKYKVKVDNNTSGDFEITGKFSYLHHNERKTVALNGNYISVSKDDEPIVQNDNQPTEEVEEIAEITENNQQEESKLNEIPPSVVKIERSIQKTGTQEYLIQIKIEQSGVNGFAKIQEILPSGNLKATGIDKQNSVFSNVDGLAKFVWMSVPEESTYSVSYNLSGELSEEDLNNMEGVFAYLENEETRKQDIITNNIDLTFEEEILVENNENSENLINNTSEINTDLDNTASDIIVEAEEIINETTEEIKAELPIEETIVEQVSDEISVEPEIESEPIASNNETPTMTNIPSPETGVNYKVQICAGHDKVDVSKHFNKEYQFNEESISTENHEGWIKYTIGAFDVYKEARDRRNVVTDGYSFPGPFVTAYNSGQRITVQEALMISNQKWIQ